MTFLFLRNAFAAWLVVALLTSCGGGGGGASSGVVGIDATPHASAGTTVTGSASAPLSGGRFEVGEQGGADGAASGSGTGTSAGSSSSASAAASNSGSSGDSSGVGSGGTGVSADASTSVGSVGGLGSIILNGIRYDTTGAILDLRDATELKIGMTAKVTGPIDAGFLTGNALRIESSADLRGVVTGIDAGKASFNMLGTTVTTDPATVWADLPGFASVSVGASLQVWAIPGASGNLRATRVEQVVATAAAILTGAVQGIDTARQTFNLGGLTVGYGIASGLGAVETSALVEGALVRVRANAVYGGGVLVASRVQRWNAVATAQGLRVQLAGIATDYERLGAFKLLGISVDATAAQIIGGQAGNIGNGVKLEVAGIFADGALRATRVRITNLPGTGARSSFNLIGVVGGFRSTAEFRVRGQLVDASRAGVQFVDGGVGALGNGVRVTVVGSQVSDGVLIAERVTFD